MTDARYDFVEPSTPVPGTDAAREEEGPTAPIGVSVVVPTHRRPAMLLRCLQALAAQRLDRQHFEVVVVDESASAEARAIVGRYAEIADLQIRCLAVPGIRGPAAARNIGWRAARGEIIAFTDDDCVPDAGWLAAGLAAFGPGVDGVEGRVVVPLPNWPTEYEKNVARLALGEFVTANCFYRRDVLEAVGGFDERFRAPGREDSDLFFTLLERGGVFERAEGAVVIHPIRPAGWGVSLREQRKSSWDALLYKKHPALYRKRIEPRPPWMTYATTMALMTAVTSTARGRTRRAALAGAAWLALSARFCARRLAGTARTPSHVAEVIVTSALIPPLSVFWRLRGALRHRVRFL